MKMQACCRPFSSRETLSFPRCFAESRSTSAGEKYGLYNLTLAAVDDSGILKVNSIASGRTGK